MLKQPSQVAETKTELAYGPLSKDQWPSLDHIVTEDGAAVDGVFSEKQMRLLTGPLYANWQPDRPFLAFANVGLFYGVNTPPIVPDVMLSLDVQAPPELFDKINRSYFVWNYGKSPDVAIEVVSNREGGEDTTKIDLYANARVGHYIIFDPDHELSNETVRYYKLMGTALELQASGPIRLPQIGLGLELWRGPFETYTMEWLRWTDLEGRLIETADEKSQQESTRANTAEEKLAALHRKLQQQGINLSD